MEKNTLPLDDEGSQSQGNTQGSMDSMTHSELRPESQLSPGYPRPPDPNYQQQREVDDSWAALFAGEDEAKTSDEAFRDPRTRGPDAPLLRKLKINSIVALMIVQKGECTKMPEAFALNLLCVKKGSFEGCGALLMGLYLYTILCRSLQSGFPLQPGLLELARGFYNLEGLCLYSKFGFDHDPNLLGPDCFYDAGNMPMDLDFEFAPYGGFDAFGKLDGIAIARKLVAIVVGTDRGHKLPICNRRDPKIQYVLSSLKEFERYLAYLLDGKIDVDKLQELCKNNVGTELMFMTDNVPKFNSLIPGLITGLESVNPPSPHIQGFVDAVNIDAVTPVLQDKFNVWVGQTSSNPGGGKKK
jgi:hypothetical protein